MNTIEKYFIFAFLKRSSGGIGRRAGFKIQFLRECGFDSHLEYRQTFNLLWLEVFCFYKSPAKFWRNSNNGFHNKLIKCTTCWFFAKQLFSLLIKLLNYIINHS